MQTKEQKKQEENLIFGIRPIIEAINAGKEIDRLLIQNGLSNELFGQLMGLLKKNNIAYQYVPIEKLNRITSKNHQGVVGYISNVVYYNIEEVIIQVIEAGRAPLILILDRITDVRNFGAIARTAECSGVDAIVIPMSGSAQINADAMKTSAGALNKIPVCKENNLKDVIELAKKMGLQIVACTEKAKAFYFQQDFTVPTAIIMGSEENGITNEFLQISDASVKIPMMGTISSLNVSVAAGIILYEAVSQRMIE
jgi:23S rRNA (guanosine2251-2'-O)-methyltransferase